MNTDLQRFFHPRSVAVVGASADGQKVGAIALANVINSGFRGDVYPINPKGGTIQGLRVYPNLSSVARPIDLVLIATPVQTILPIIDEIGSLAIKNVVVFTAGFGELGAKGHALEEMLHEKIAAYKLNLLGPNCLGFVTTATPLNTTFAQNIKEKGNFFLLSQSGAIASSIFDWCQASGMGLSTAVTVGNKIGLNENHILSYWLYAHKEIVAYRTGMAHVMPIGMYLESISDGEQFVRLCKKLVVNHPLFILKPGKSQAAQKAMQSHTGSLAGEDTVLETALKESGVIRCNGMEDFFDLTKAFSWEDAPKGPRLAVVSNAGGPAVISADVIAAYGLSVAHMSDKTKQKLLDVLPSSASVKNPIDVLGDAMADRYEAALTAVLSEDNVDGLVAILTPQVMTEIEKTAQVIGRLSRHFKKPILCSFIGGSRTAIGEKILNSFKIPVFRFPERAIYAFASMWSWQSTREAVRTERVPAQVPPVEKVLDISSYGPVLSSLKEYGVSYPPTVRVSTLEQAKDFLRRQPDKVVLKLYAPELLHKKEMGAVVVNIKTHAQLEAGFSKLRQSREYVKKRLGVESHLYIQRQEKIEIELLVGVKTDPQFGKILLFGAGGALAELIQDTNMLMLPTNKERIKKSLLASKAGALLSGFRGEEPYDVAAVVDVICSFARWAQAHATIAEAEINPLIVNRKGAYAVDVKVINA